MWAKAQVLLTTISFSSLAFMVDLWNQDYNTMFISRTPRPFPSQEVENFGIFSSYGGWGKSGDLGGTFVYRVTNFGGRG